MNRCPENDKILLFCERELSDVEQAQFELHLKTCAECRRELEQTTADDALLRAGIEEAFSHHRVNHRIMAQIRNEKIARPAADPHKGWRYFWLTAFALLAIVAVISLYTPSPSRYHGHTDSIMIQAVNDQSTLQDEKLSVNQIFTLEALKPVSIDGTFLFTVSDPQTSVFKVSGRAIARLCNGTIEFTDAEACFELISGRLITILVNGSPRKLERKTLISAPFNTSELVPDRLRPPVVCASTTATPSVIIENSPDTPNLIDLPVASITTATEATSGITPWTDMPLTPGKNPFADEPLDLNGN